jgi:hypothetical protein
VETYKDNLRKIVYAAGSVGAKVVLIGPGPFNHQQFDDALGHQFEVDRTTHRAREYCEATTDVGKELNIPTVPMWHLVMEDLGWKEGDPIHGLPELPAVNPLNDYFTDGMFYTFDNEHSWIMQLRKSSYRFTLFRPGLQDTFHECAESNQRDLPGT